MSRLLLAMLICACAGTNPAPTVTSEPATPSQPPEPEEAAPGYTIVELALGETFACARYEDGRVRCWGTNELGELGVASSSARHSLLDLDAVSLAAGRHHACVVTAAGKVMCWGDRSRGRLGNGESSFGANSARRTLPAEVPNIAGATIVEAGYEFTCTVLSQGAVWCWGGGRRGQLGTDGDSASPVQIAIENVVGLAAGVTHVCARTADTGVSCWGADAAVHEIAGVAGAVELGAGLSSSCARLSDGEVRCWSRGESTRVEMPAATSIAMGGGTACATGMDGVLRCWGDGEDGQLGSGTTTRSEVAAPVDVDHPGVVALASDYGCATTGAPSETLDNLVCWGAARRGGPPAREMMFSGTPRRVESVQDARQLYAIGDTACAREASGRLRCWGQPTRRHSPSRVAPVPPEVLLEGVADLVMHHETACALMRDGTVRCWGRGGSGELGHGSQEDSSAPALVLGVSDAEQVVLGAGFACARTRGGRASCWGTSVSVLGRRPRNPQDERQVATRAQSVRGLRGATRLAAERGEICAIVAGGRVSCWGRHRGQGQRCGPGPSDAEVCEGFVAPGPVALQGVRGVASIVMEGGRAHLLGPEGALRYNVRFDPEVLTTGPATGFGRRTTRRIGARTERVDPPEVFPLAHCPRAEDGMVDCTEGDGTPPSAPGLENVRQVVRGEGFACALRDEGLVFCWGDNRAGQLGVPWPDLLRPGPVVTR